MFEGLILGMYLPGDSLIHRLDPRTKLICLAMIIILLFIETTYYAYFLNMVFLLFILIVAGIPPKNFFKGLKFILIIALITFFIHLLFTGKTPLFTFKGITFWSEGFYLGGLMALRLMLLVGFSTVLTLTTSPLKFTGALEGLFHPLTRIGIPVGQLAMMANIALRFLPTIALEAEKIIKAQASRGGGLRDGNFVKRNYALLSIVVPLFANTFRRAAELAEAMENRCYGGEKRSMMRKLKFTGRDFIVLTAVAAFTVIITII